VARGERSSISGRIFWSKSSLARNNTNASGSATIASRNHTRFRGKDGLASLDSGHRARSGAPNTTRAVPVVSPPK